MKRLISLVTLLALLLGLSACSSIIPINNAEEVEYYKNQIVVYTAENESLKKQIKALEQQVQELTDQLSIYTNADVSVGDNTTTDVPTSGITLQLGQTVRIEDVIEFTINSCSWENEVLPSNTSGSYSYKKDIEDETYLVLRGSFTNLNGNSYKIKYIQESDMLINGKYSFNVYMDAEETDGDGFSSSTKPLQTVNFVIYATVSDPVKEIFEDATITINMLNDPKRTEYYFDKEDDCKNIYTIKLTKEGLSK